MACLRNFFASPIRKIILETRIENWLPIDKLDSFVFEGTRIHVAPDFALRNLQGNALVIDWKTGRAGEEGAVHPGRASGGPGPWGRWR